MGKAPALEENSWWRRARKCLADIHCFYQRQWLVMVAAQDIAAGIDCAESRSVAIVVEEHSHVAVGSY